MHSRPQRPRSFWSAPRIATSGQLQRHSGFEWICKHNRLRPEPIRFVRLDSEHAQSDGKSVNRGHSVVGHGQRSRFLVLTKRSAASGDENERDAGGKKGKVLCCKRIFNRIEGTSAEIQPKNHSSVQKTHFLQKVPGVNGFFDILPYISLYFEQATRLAASVGALWSKSHLTENKMGYPASRELPCMTLPSPLRSRFLGCHAMPLPKKRLLSTEPHSFIDISQSQLRFHFQKPVRAKFAL